MNDANGGKSQLVSIIAAAVIALVTFYLTAPLQYIPTAALGVVLVMASCRSRISRPLGPARLGPRRLLARPGDLCQRAHHGVIPGITSQSCWGCSSSCAT